VIPSTSVRITARASGAAAKVPPVPGTAQFVTGAPPANDWLTVRDILHGPECEHSLKRPEIRLESEPVVAPVIEQFLREESR
jgi:hypothetical protein